MRVSLFASLLGVFISFSAVAAEVGFQSVSVPDLPGSPLAIGIWYPASAVPSDRMLNLFTQHVAPEAPVAGGGHALIVMSHGHGGSLDNHYDTALALAHAGFVVVSITHTGDNYRDLSRSTDLPARTRAIHTVVGYMLADWPSHAAIDETKIGMFGFSIGAFTALVSIGGVPDLAKVGPFCAAHRQAYSCILAQESPVTTPIVDTDWVRESRIKAAVVAAPAIGFAFAPSGLAAVHVPIQLWRAADDHILPSPDYVEPVRAALPIPPEYHVVAGADHFDFLAPCSDALAHAVPSICSEHGDFNRAAFHQAFNADVVSFFLRTLH